MNTKDLERSIKKVCKEEHGETLTFSQIKAVLEAFRTVAIDACKKGDCVSIRKFITVGGVMTVPRILPNGETTKPRLKIKATVSKTLQEEFKKEVVGEDK